MFNLYIEAFLWTSSPCPYRPNWIQIFLEIWIKSIAHRSSCVAFSLVIGRVSGTGVDFVWTDSGTVILIYRNLSRRLCAWPKREKPIPFCV